MGVDNEGRIFFSKERIIRTEESVIDTRIYPGAAQQVQISISKNHQNEPQWSDVIDTDDHSQLLRLGYDNHYNSAKKSYYTSTEIESRSIFFDE